NQPRTVGRDSAVFGTITGTYGMPVTMTLTGPAYNKVTTTDVNGFYGFAGIPIGNFTLSVSCGTSSTAYLTTAPTGYSIPILTGNNYVRNFTATLVPSTLLLPFGPQPQQIGAATLFDVTNTYQVTCTRATSA